MTATTPEGSAGERDITRLTPYELVFTTADFESRVFPSIRAEADEYGAESLDLGRFAFLTTVSDAVRDLTSDEAPPEALEQYRALLFHAYHFWLNGRRLFVLDRALARFLVESSPSLEDWTFSAPLPAGYAQLPANLFWSSISSDTPPEPVDGFFFTISTGADPLGARSRILQLLLVLGIRRERSGFSVIRLETLLDPLVSPAERETPREREGGAFSSVLPGGDLAGLYSILTTDEGIEIAQRTLWYIDRFPEGTVEVAAPEPSDEPKEPPATKLAHARLRLAATDATSDADDDG